MLQGVEGRLVAEKERFLGGDGVDDLVCERSGRSPAGLVGEFGEGGAAGRLGDFAQPAFDQISLRRVQVRPQRSWTSRDMARMSSWVACKLPLPLSHETDDFVGHVLQGDGLGYALLNRFPRHPEDHATGFVLGQQAAPRRCSRRHPAAPSLPMPVISTPSALRP